jgi:iron complex outermembrane receptor protein
MIISQKTLLICTVASFLSTVMASSAFAQVATASADERQSEGIEAIIVTARKVNENIQSIPEAVTALTAETLIQANIRTAQELSRLTPGVQANQSAYDNQNVVFKVRGMSQSVATQESSVGVYIDGVYQPMIFGLNSAMFDLERVEIAKGPQGTLYGKNTTGGVVNILMRRPDLDAFSRRSTFLWFPANSLRGSAPPMTIAMAGVAKAMETSSIPATIITSAANCFSDLVMI